MPKYYNAENTGKGFITHEDNELAHVSGYPGNVWVTENTAWAARHYLVEMTKLNAQTLVNTAISGSVDEDGNPVPPDLLSKYDPEDMYTDMVFLKQTYREKIREKFEGRMVIGRKNNFFVQKRR